jgi:hypothetical protein
LVSSPGSFDGEAHREIREAIKRSLERRDPLIVVTGDSGTGKTALCRAVLEEAKGAASSTVVNPFLTFRDLLKQVLSDLDPASGTSAADSDVDLVASEHDLIRSIQRFIQSNPHRLAVVVIDDAHLLNSVVFAQLRALLNVSADGRGLTILLVGQPALEATLRRPEFRSVEQRIAQRYRIEPQTNLDAPGGPVGRERRPAAARRLAAGAAALFVAGWIADEAWRRAFPAVSPALPEHRLSEPPAPAARAAQPPAPSASPRAEPSVNPAVAHGALSSRVPVPQPESTKDEYAALRRTVERQMPLLVTRGDVKALLALRADTENRYRRLGAVRPDFIAGLLDALDVKIEEARAVRLKLDAQAFRR